MTMMATKRKVWLNTGSDFDSTPVKARINKLKKAHPKAHQGTMISHQGTMAKYIHVLYTLVAWKQGGRLDWKWRQSRLEAGLRDIKIYAIAWNLTGKGKLHVAADRVLKNHSGDKTPIFRIATPSWEYRWFKDQETCWEIQQVLP